MLWVDHAATDHHCHCRSVHCCTYSGHNDTRLGIVYCTRSTNSVTYKQQWTHRERDTAQVLTPHSPLLRLDPLSLCLLATPSSTHSTLTLALLLFLLFFPSDHSHSHCPVLMSADSSSSSGGDIPITLSTFYQYDPVLGILIAAAILFGFETAVLLFQSLRSRAYFLLWLVLFAACETGGYVAFCFFQQNPALNSYLAELILIILAPNFVTLVNYVVISRIIRWAGFENKSVLARRARLVPAVFLSSDLLCLVLQSIGGSQLSQSQSHGSFNQSKYNLGRNFTLAGISAQLAFQSIFALLAVYIYCRMPNQAVKSELRWAWLCMLITMVLVSMRNIYRIVEFAGGRYSAVDSTQVPYMVLDLLLMLLVGLTFTVLDLGSDWVLPSRFRKPVASNTGTNSRDATNRKMAEPELSYPNTRNTEISAADSA